jgi:hypothetical protein
LANQWKGGQWRLPGAGLSVGALARQFTDADVEQGHQLKCNKVCVPVNVFLTLERIIFKVFFN